MALLNAVRDVAGVVKCDTKKHGTLPERRRGYDDITCVLRQNKKGI